MSENTYKVGDEVVIKGTAKSWGGKTNLRGKKVRIVQVGPYANLDHGEFEVTPVDERTYVNQIFRAEDFESRTEQVVAEDLRVGDEVHVGDMTTKVTLVEKAPNGRIRVRLDAKGLPAGLYMPKNLFTITKRENVEFAVGTIINLDDSLLVKEGENAWRGISGQHKGSTYLARQDIERRIRRAEEGDEYEVIFKPEKK